MTELSVSLMAPFLERRSDGFPLTSVLDYHLHLLQSREKEMIHNEMCLALTQTQILNVERTAQKKIQQLRYCTDLNSNRTSGTLLLTAQVYSGETVGYGITNSMRTVSANKSLMFGVSIVGCHGLQGSKGK